MKNKLIIFTQLGMTLGCSSAAFVLNQVASANEEVFFTEEQAAMQIFPGMKFIQKTIELSEEEVTKIEKLSGANVRNKKIRIWVGPKKDVVIIDKVIGKHDFITYALGLTSEAQVKEVEIIEYRETYGYEVRRPEWRAQFHGKQSSAPLKVKQDIKNISGATLSVVHVTDGVRRLLHTYELVKNRL